MTLVNKKNKDQRHSFLKRGLVVFVLLCTTALMAQTPMGLGSKMASPNAVVHMGTQGGLIIPKVSLTSATVFLAGKTATADDVSMLVYNTNTATANGLSGTGFYFWTGSTWTRFSTSVAVADNLGNHIATQDIKLGNFGITDTDGNTKIQVDESNNDDIIRFDTAGTERMQISKTGNVGIGTAAAAATRLDVRSAMSKNFGGLSIMHSNGTQGLNFGHEGIAKSGSAANTNLTLDAKGVGNVLLNSTATGNVGIGSTNAPHKLTVNGNAQVTGAIYDSGGSKGSGGQVLTATAAGTDWAAPVLPTGTIIPFVGNGIPSGWLFCNGAAIPVNATTAALRALIGTNTPDLRGRFLRGAGGKGPTIRTMQGQAIQSHNHPIDLTQQTVANTGQHTHVVTIQADAARYDTTTNPQFISYGRQHQQEPTPPDYTSLSVSSRVDGDHNHGFNVKGNTNNSGGTDTRPDNYGVYYMIKL